MSDEQVLQEKFLTLSTHGKLKEIISFIQEYPDIDIYINECQAFSQACDHKNIMVIVWFLDISEYSDELVSLYRIMERKGMIILFKMLSADDKTIWNYYRAKYYVSDKIYQQWDRYWLTKIVKEFLLDEKIVKSLWLDMVQNKEDKTKYYWYQIFSKYRLANLGKNKAKL